MGRDLCRRYLRLKRTVNLSYAPFCAGDAFLPTPAGPDGIPPFLRPRGRMRSGRGSPIGARFRTLIPRHDTHGVVDTLTPGGVGRGSHEGGVSIQLRDQGRITLNLHPGNPPPVPSHPSVPPRGTTLTLSSYDEGERGWGTLPSRPSTPLPGGVLVLWSRGTGP